MQDGRYSRTRNRTCNHGKCKLAHRSDGVRSEPQAGTFQPPICHRRDERAEAEPRRRMEGSYRTSAQRGREALRSRPSISRMAISARSRCRATCRWPAISRTSTSTSNIRGTVTRIRRRQIFRKTTMWRSTAVDSRSTRSLRARWKTTARSASPSTVPPPRSTYGLTARSWVTARTDSRRANSM